MKKLFLTLLCAFPLIGMERLKPENIVAPSRLGDIDLRHDDNGLYLMKDGEAQRIERHQCDATLRKLLAAKKLKEFQDADGYIKINTMGEDNEMLSLSAKMRGPGGGPWVSLAVFGVCQVGGYTALLTSAMVANTLAPGAGGVATAAVLGTGGVPAYIAGVNMWALKCSAWAFALPTP